MSPVELSGPCSGGDKDRATAPTLCVRPRQKCTISPNLLSPKLSTLNPKTSKESFGAHLPRRHIIGSRGMARKGATSKANMES